MEVVTTRPPYCTDMVQNLCYNPQPDHHERHTLTTYNPWGCTVA